MEDQITHIASLLAKSRGTIVLTGAGISAESGLRTFRGASHADLPADMQALWKEFDPVKLATPEAFDADPAAVSRWYDWRRLGCLAAIPNPGHTTLAEFERRATARRANFTILTQNVDRLHHKAGSANVVELHGSIIQWRCTSCETKTTPGPEPLPQFPITPACCPDDSAALLRPDVVWFGEQLPYEALAAADEALASCDLFFSVGTSSVVQPAASFIQIAAQNGATTIEINAESTPISRFVDHSIRGRSGEILPRILAAMGPA